MPVYRVGVDIGGTFTDFVLVDETTGTMHFAKELTSPHDPSEAVLSGVRTLLAAHRVPLTSVDSIVHGTTLCTNAVIERRGAPTGLLTTRGFVDLLDLGRERRYDLFDLRLKFPAPLVARAQRRELGERVRYDGVVLEALDLAEVDAAVDDLVQAHGIEALAVCLLHAYVNPRHEEQVRDRVRMRHPDLAVSTSAEVFPFAGEYERFTTTAMNAYVQPMVDRYLTRLQSALAADGFRGTLYVMTSAGGTMTLDTARRFPVRLLESGPVAGALMSATAGRQIGRPDLLSFDMGGTTAKGCIILDHAAPEEVRVRGRANARVQARQRSARPRPLHRHGGDRRRRRQHRGGGCSRPAARGPAERGRGSGTGVLRTRREAADLDRRKPAAWLSRSGILQRRPDAPRSRRQPGRQSRTASPASSASTRPRRRGASTKSSTKMSRARSACTRPSAASTIAAAA